ncbi:class I SAM-dependent rRNA methyltransferase [Phyllobacterium sp. BT25]|uniref:Class I SAM-dependent rRNA methyltransferase n=1 Tax=Phyllobacterium pellucidum TaxID=2740464 RepID=A0A849VMG3_9HYPH|nr:class I SAM-dependent rRNA methyltransferase [Phyllobacterium pellucidum]NTS31011.1 class I SAM-dependent rRNA methyltransferase [Phyllobacterium pellucidum]
MKPSGGKTRKTKSAASKANPAKGAVQWQSPVKPRPQFAKQVRTPAIDAPAQGGARQDASPRRVLVRRSGARPEERTGLILETLPSEDYALLDSGNGLKLEQYGPYRIVRPEGQAIWLPAWAKAEWDKADAVFTGNTDEEGVGRWHFPKVPLGETWPLAFDELPFYGRFTSFRHVGVFPEQGTHWAHMDRLIRNAKRPVKVLNLFGYTGVASLVAARAGAEVTHVDASKKAIAWARENQEMAGLSSKPIRWICEDAMKFVMREERRGSTYDIILLDPPAYGRGPGGEVWQLFDNLPDMVDICRAILSPNALSVVLTAYSIRASFFAIHELMRDAFTGLGGTVESGELILRERSSGRALSTSLFSRWENT